MIQKETILNVIDNTGVQQVKCIGLFSKKTGQIGDRIVVSVVKTQSQQYRKGTVCHGLIVQTKKPLKRSTYTTISWFNQNAVVLLTDQKTNMQLLGRRVFGSLPRELRKTGNFKILSLARFIL